MPPKKMTANPVRPARYRPGKPVAEEQPSESESEEEEEEEEEAVEEERPQQKKPISGAATVSANLKKVNLNERFEQSRKEEQARKEAEEAARQAEIEEEANRKAQEEAEEEYETDTSSEEEESEEEEPQPRRVLLRPTFIPKSKRNAVGGLNAEEEAAALRAKEEERKKAEAEAKLEEHLKRDAEARAAGRKGYDDDDPEGDNLDDTDDLDPAMERAAWKLRELMRIKRERDALEKVEKEREEIEARRNMDEQERLKEDLEYVAKQREEAKEARGKMGFMQKYYHKGAFYQDDDSKVVQRKDYATAKVEDEVVNRDILPKYLQVRGDEVGKRGRTRWTHLTAEDTTLQNGQAASPWYDKRSAVNKRFMEKQGGLKDANVDPRFMPDSRKRDGEEDRGDRRDDRRSDRGDDRRDYRDSDRDRNGGDDYRPRRDRGDRDIERLGPRDRRDDRSDRRRDDRQDRYVPDRDRGDSRDYGRDRRRDRSRDRSRDRHRDRSRDRDRRRDHDRKRSPSPGRKDGVTDKRRRVEA